MIIAFQIIQDSEVSSRHPSKCRVLTGGSGVVKAEFRGANMVMFSMGLFSAAACPKPCISKSHQPLQVKEGHA